MDEVKKIANLIVKYKDDRELIRFLFFDSFQRAAKFVDNTKSYISSYQDMSSCFKVLIILNLDKCMKILLDYNLIESRSKIYFSYNIDKTPLHLAVETPGAYDCFKLLCDNKYSDLNKTFHNGSFYVTALYLACKQNSIEKMKLLLSNGADINSAPSVLMDATSRGNLEITRLLIENGINTNITISGETPLLLAARGNFKEIMDILIRGIDVEKTPPKKKAKTAENECIICLAASKEVVFIPCGHVCCCSKCGLKTSLLQCPACRLKITSRQKIFL